MKNSVELIGRLGADPEIRTIQGGTKVATLSVSTWESYYDQKNQKWETISEWHRVIAWGDQCDRIAKIGKGDLVLVEGKIKTRKYTDSHGVEKYTTEIVGYVKAMPNAKGKESTTEQPTPPDEQHSNSPNNGEDDLPF